MASRAIGKHAQTGVEFKSGLERLHSEIRSFDESAIASPSRLFF